MTIALPSASEVAAALIAREELPPEKGDLGPQGKAGEDGGFGPPGPQGPKGDPGRNGVDGAPGDLGPVGPQGKQGDRGLKGDKGDKGDEGDRGEQGPIGPTGAAGSGRSFFPRGSGGSGSGLPSGGTVGQVVTNTAPGTGTWQDGSGLPPQWTDGGNGDVTATVDDITKTPITLQAIVGQTGHLFRWYDENGVLKGNIDFEGFLDVTRLAVQNPPDTGGGESVVLNAGAESIAVTRNTPGDVAFKAVELPSSSSYYLIKTPGLGADNGYVEFTQLNNADTMFLMVAAAAPSSDHLQIWNNAFDAKLFRIFKTGAIGTSANAAPPDGDLSANEMGVYFDPTNGAAVPKWKGRSADGTVVSGSLSGLSGSAQTYTESNVTTDRAFNANATSIDELADVLGTLIADLRNRGVVA